MSTNLKINRWCPAGGSAGWNVILYTKRLQGSIPSQGTHGKQLMDVLLSHHGSPSLPLPLKINKNICGEDEKKKI